MAKLNKFRKLALLAVLVAALTLGLTAPGHALELFDLNREPEETVKIIKTDDVIDDNVAIFAKNTQVEGVIKGDLLVVGKQISVSGRVEGNLVALAGAQLKLTGEIKNNILAISPEVLLKGKVGRDAFIVAQNLKSEPGFWVGGDLFVNASNASGLKNAKIGGKTAVRTGSFKPNYKSLLASLLASMLSLIFTGILFLRFAQRTFEVSANMLRQHWGKSFLAGAIGIIFAPVIGLILISSALVSPLGMIIIALWLTQLYLSVIVSSYFAGQVITKGRWGNYWSLIIGVIFVSILSRLPIVSGLAWALILITGFGGLYLAQAKAYKKMKADKII